MKYDVIGAVSGACKLENVFANKLVVAFSFISIQHLIEQHHLLIDHRDSILLLSISQTLLFFAGLCILRHPPKIDFPALRELQYIFLYGLVLQAGFLLANADALPPTLLTQATILHSVLGSLYFMGLLWSVMNHGRNASAPWLAFGIFGILTWWRHRPHVGLLPMFPHRSVSFQPTATHADDKPDYGYRVIHVYPWSRT